ncbi:MAG: CDP-glucose 4,6-dehydratase [Verrucomicrobiota bacterium]
MKDSFGRTFRGKKVFLTGHTGFKGAWLSEWLLSLGAKVTGYALPPNTKPSLFAQLGLRNRITHIEADIRDSAKLSKTLHAAKPDFVFHLAAQAIVRESYAMPAETFDTNAMGTAHVLDALRNYKNSCAAVFVTTDKCYENREWVHGYREEDKLGGHDPYSASKAAAEIIIASYRSSFFQNHPVKIASARAGNVIGGGDWAVDRIIPDCIRALQKKQPIPVRNKIATRPWQHVLEPLSGYLWLAAVLANPKLSKIAPQLIASAFNFGPRHESNRTVAELVAEVLQHWPGKWKDKSDPKAVHEAKLLQLATDKAHAMLGWSPTWNFSEGIENTVRWYRDCATAKSPQEFQVQTLFQINQYSEKAHMLNVAWTK